MVLWRNGECCGVEMGEALLCLSALLCQFALQLLINKKCYLNLKLPQMLHIWWGGVSFVCWFGFWWGFVLLFRLGVFGWVLLLLFGGFFVVVFWAFFVPSHRIFSFIAENWIKGERLMAGTSAASQRHPCATPPGNHTQNNLWKLLTGHLRTQTSVPALQHPLPNPAAPNTGSTCAACGTPSPGGGKAGEGQVNKSNAVPCSCGAAEGKERGLSLSPGAAAAALHKAQFPAPWGGAGDARSVQRQPRRKLGSHFPAPGGGAALPQGSGPPHGARHCAHYITAPAPPPAAPLTCAAVTCPNSSLNRFPGKGDYSTGTSFKGGSRRLALARIPPAQRERPWAPHLRRAPLCLILLPPKSPSWHVWRLGTSISCPMHGHHTDRSHNPRTRVGRFLWSSSSPTPLPW